MQLEKVQLSVDKQMLWSVSRILLLRANIVCQVCDSLVHHVCMLVAALSLVNVSLRP